MRKGDKRRNLLGRYFMVEGKKEKRRLARREFLGTGAVLAAGALSASASVAQGTKAQKPWLPKKWDYEADVVIAGIGYAGQSAAIAAHDAGAKVIVLEKATKELSGGNSSCAVGGNSVWDDPKECYMDLRHAGQDVPDELVRAMVDCLAMGGSQNVLGWLKKLGIEMKAGGQNTKKTWFIANAETGGQNGSHLHRAIQAQVEKRKIKIMYETPAKELVQDPVTKEILGVVAYEGTKGFYGEGGKKVYI